MVVTIRCISQHAEEVIVGSEESAPVMVPAGGFAYDVDLSNPINSRLLAEGLIIKVPEEKSKRKTGSQNEGDDK